MNAPKRSTCDNCGGPLPYRHRRWCFKKECQEKAAKTHKMSVLALQRRYGDTKRKPDSIKPKGHPERTCQYPPNATHKCGKPLTNTANYFFCREHAKDVSMWDGIEAAEK